MNGFARWYGSLFLVVSFLLGSLTEIASAEFDLERDLYATFSDRRLRKMVFAEYYHSLAEEILRLDPAKGLVRKEVLVKYVDDLELLNDCLVALNKTRVYLKTLKNDEWVVVVDKFHRNIAFRLMKLQSKGKRVFFRLDQALGFVSNVADTTDGELSVSQMGSLVTNSQLRVLFQTREFPWGTYHVWSGAALNTYNDKVVNDRNKLTANIGVGAALPVKNTVLSSVEIKLEYAADHFKTTKGGDFALMHLKPQIIFIHHPLRVNFLNINNIDSKTTLKVDVRSYAEDERDAFGNSKNGSFLRLSHDMSTMLFKNKSRLNVSFGFEGRDVDAENYDYWSLLFEMGLKHRVNQIVLNPFFHLKTRNDMIYLNFIERDDLQTEAGLQIYRTIRSEKIHGFLEYKRVNNHSSVERFEFDSNVFLFGVQCNW